MMNYINAVLNSNHIIKEVHISTIKAGDTVNHKGDIKTITPKDINYSTFMGYSIFGDSYRIGTILVKKVIFKKK